MAKSNLMSRVKGHVSGQKTSGQNTLGLTVECVEHMFGESGDWTPLAFLIGRSEPAQSRMVKGIANKVIQGYSLKKDEGQPSGFRFAKIEGKNQGLDKALLDTVIAFRDKKLSIQSQDVKTFVAGEKAERPADKVAEGKAKAIAKWLVKEGYGLDTLIGQIKSEYKSESAKS